MKTLLCCIAKREQLYIKEWVDYHLRIGFTAVKIYDNEDTPGSMNSLRRPDVQIVHFPGPVKQMPAYTDCLKETSYDFIAFFDVDEFLVLRSHANVSDWINHVLSLAPSGPDSVGAIGINWLFFGAAGLTAYVPAPVLERFTMSSKEPDRHVKAIVRPRMASGIPNPHFANLAPGKLTVNTDGIPFLGPWNDRIKPETSAVLHHYYTKSKQEFYEKCKRGRADIVQKRNFEVEWSSRAVAHNDVRNTSAMDCLQRCNK
jgi:hypothetical protein